MMSLKIGSGFISNLSRFALNRQIYLSSRKQTDSDEWRPPTVNNTSETNPIAVGVEKSLL